MFSAMELNAQERKIVEHPFFQAILDGEWNESGQAVIGGKVLEGESVFSAESVLGGLWIQQDGKAKFGNLEWDWRWMFRLRRGPNTKEIVQGRYIDSLGQVSDYLGEWNESATVLRLVRQLDDKTRSVIQVSNLEGGNRLVEVAVVDTSGKTSVQYRATGKKTR